MLQMDELFRRKAEECLELAKRAVDKEDRAFWQKLAQSWQERLRQYREPTVSTSRDARANTRRVTGKKGPARSAA